MTERPDGRRLLTTYRWGLVPMGAKDPAALRSTFNARAETIAARPTFRSAFRRGRILVPVRAFYEWRTVGSVKTSPTSSPGRTALPSFFAGLAERWRRPGESIMRSATIITTEAGPDMDGIHDRMPSGPGARRPGRTGSTRPSTTATSSSRCSGPPPAGTLVHHEVARAVGNVRQRRAGAATPPNDSRGRSQPAVGGGRGKLDRPNVPTIQAL